MAAANSGSSGATAKLLASIRQLQESFRGFHSDLNELHSTQGAHIRKLLDLPATPCVPVPPLRAAPVLRSLPPQASVPTGTGAQGDTLTSAEPKVGIAGLGLGPNLRGLPVGLGGGGANRCKRGLEALGSEEMLRRKVVEYFTDLQPTLPDGGPLAGLSTEDIIDLWLNEIDNDTALISVMYSRAAGSDVRQFRLGCRDGVWHVQKMLAPSGGDGDDELEASLALSPTRVPVRNADAKGGAASPMIAAKRKIIPPPLGELFPEEPDPVGIGPRAQSDSLAEAIRHGLIVSDAAQQPRDVFARFSSGRNVLSRQDFLNLVSIYGGRSPAAAPCDSHAISLFEQLAVGDDLDVERGLPYEVFVKEFGLAPTDQKRNSIRNAPPDIIIADEDDCGRAAVAKAAVAAAQLGDSATLSTIPSLIDAFRFGATAGSPALREIIDLAIISQEEFVALTAKIAGGSALKYDSSLSEGGSNTSTDANGKLLFEELAVDSIDGAPKHIPMLVFISELCPEQKPSVAESASTLRRNVTRQLVRVLKRSGTPPKCFSDTGEVLNQTAFTALIHEALSSVHGPKDVGVIPIKVLWCFLLDKFQKWEDRRISSSDLLSYLEESRSDSSRGRHGSSPVHHANSLELESDSDSDQIVDITPFTSPTVSRTPATAALSVDSHRGVGDLTFASNPDNTNRLDHDTASRSQGKKRLGYIGSPVLLADPVIHTTLCHLLSRLLEIGFGVTVGVPNKELADVRGVTTEDMSEAAENAFDVILVAPGGDGTQSEAIKFARHAEMVYFTNSKDSKYGQPGWLTSMAADAEADVHDLSNMNVEILTFELKKHSVAPSLPRGSSRQRRPSRDMTVSFRNVTEQPSDALGYAKLATQLEIGEKVLVGAVVYDQKALLLKALELDPTHAQAHADLGCVLSFEPGSRVFLNGKDYSEVDLYLQALELDPTLALPYANLSEVISKDERVTIRGRTYDASELAQQAAKLQDPDGAKPKDSNEPAKASSSALDQIASDKPRRKRREGLPSVARASARSKQPEIKKVFEEIDIDSRGSLNFEDVRSYLCDYLGFGQCEAKSFYSKCAPSDCMSFEDFTAAYPLLNPFGIRKRSNETIFRKPGSLSGEMLQIEDLEDCNVFICDMTAQVTLDACKNCCILLGPCESSVFVRECENCTCWIAAQQLRTRDCKTCTFHLYSKTEPVIESSTDLSFSPWCARYPNCTLQFTKMGFDPERNLWNAIFDFTGKAGSANWRIMPLQDVLLLSAELSEQPDALVEPDNPCNLVTHVMLCADSVSSGDGCGNSVANIPQTRPSLPPAPPPGCEVRVWTVCDDCDAPAAIPPQEAVQETSVKIVEASPGVSGADVEGKSLMKDAKADGTSVKDLAGRELVGSMYNSREVRRRSLERKIAAAEHVHGANHVSVAAELLGLASFHQEGGEFTHQREALQRTCKIYEALLSTGREDDITNITAALKHTITQLAAVHALLNENDEKMALDKRFSALSRPVGLQRTLSPLASPEPSPKSASHVSLASRSSPLGDRLLGMTDFLHSPLGTSVGSAVLGNSVGSAKASMLPLLEPVAAEVLGKNEFSKEAADGAQKDLHLQYLEQNPMEASAYIRLSNVVKPGEMVIFAGRNYSKQDLLLKAIEIDPNQDRAYSDLAVALDTHGEDAHTVVQGRRVGAKELYVESLRLNPDQAKVHRRLAALLRPGERVAVPGSSVSPGTGRTEVDAETLLLRAQNIEDHGSRGDSDVHMKGSYLRAVELDRGDALSYVDLASILAPQESIQVGGQIHTRRGLLLRAIELDAACAKAYAALAAELRPAEEIQVKNSRMGSKELYIRALVLDQFLSRANSGLAQLLENDERVTISGVEFGAVELEARAFESLSTRTSPTASSSQKLPGLSHEQRLLGSSASTSLAKVCVCGNIFLDDSIFCRQCGKKRPMLIEKESTQAARSSNDVDMNRSQHLPKQKTAPEIDHGRHVSENLSATASALGPHGEGHSPETQLLHIRRESGKTNMFEVPRKRASMTHGDCFILADGKTVYTWMGNESTPFEKNACAMHAENLARARHGHVAEPDSRFWDCLGGEGPIGQPEDDEGEVTPLPHGYVPTQPTTSPSFASPPSSPPPQARGRSPLASTIGALAATRAQFRGTGDDSSDEEDALRLVKRGMGGLSAKIGSIAKSGGTSELAKSAMARRAGAALLGKLGADSSDDDDDATAHKPGAIAGGGTGMLQSLVADTLKGKALPTSKFVDSGSSSDELEVLRHACNPSASRGGAATSASQGRAAASASQGDAANISRSLGLGVPGLRQKPRGGVDAGSSDDS